MVFFYLNYICNMKNIKYKIISDICPILNYEQKKNEKKSFYSILLFKNE